MDSDRSDALKEFLAAFDQRMEAAPVIERREQTDRRAQPDGKPVEGRRARGPVKDAFAYWEAKDEPKDT